MKTYIVDYACGVQKGHVCGLDHVAYYRTLAALRAKHKYRDARFVLAAGMAFATHGCGTLADNACDFLRAHDIPMDMILMNPHGHSTFSETVSAHAIISRDAGHRFNARTIRLVCATSRFHAPRVWLIWRIGYGVAPTLETTSLRPMFREYPIEFIKIIHDIYRACILRLRLYHFK